MDRGTRGRRKRRNGRRIASLGCILLLWCETNQDLAKD